jgi:acyl dehydratase
MSSSSITHAVSDNVLEFRGRPGRMISYARVLMSRKPHLAPVDEPLEPVEVHGRGVRIDARAVERYLRICGTSAQTLAVPSLYPQVFAMPLHLRLLTAEAFPVRPLGIVHLHNVVTQTESIPMGQPFDLDTALVEKRETGPGQEYDIVTRCRIGEDVPWQARTTFLVRRPATDAKPARPARPAGGRRAVMQESLVPVDAPEDIGRRYARVSDDYNPIHLYARTAAWFGFRKAIAHGMWSLAATLVAAQRDAYRKPVRVAAHFHAPIYLPSSLAVATVTPPDDHGSLERYVLRDAHKPRVHLEVEVGWL